MVIQQVSTDVASIREVVPGLLVLLKQEREIAALAADNGDEGTVDLVTGYISGQGKVIWMLNRAQDPLSLRRKGGVISVF